MSSKVDDDSHPSSSTLLTPLQHKNKNRKITLHQGFLTPRSVAQPAETTMIICWQVFALKYASLIICGALAGLFAPQPADELLVHDSMISKWNDFCLQKSCI